MNNEVLRIILNSKKLKLSSQLMIYYNIIIKILLYHWISNNYLGPYRSVFCNCGIIITVKFYVINSPFEAKNCALICSLYPLYNSLLLWLLFPRFTLQAALVFRGLGGFDNYTWTKNRLFYPRFSGQKLPVLSMTKLVFVFEGWSFMSNVTRITMDACIVKSVVSLSTIPQIPYVIIHLSCGI